MIPHELIIDNFAGGGGASTGIELAIGRQVDIAINHDPDSILMHKTNHPHTEHLCESVWDVNPKELCKGRKIALAWFSPDCTHFSKAAGGRPVDKNIRGLAWVTLRWASLPEDLKPRVIILENVEEFVTWGPLIDGKPDPKRRGITFRSFVNALKRNGYHVEHRELVACDYGAPTSRKRFFLIARSDGRPIMWPAQTHGPGRIPYRTAAEILDWSRTCPSIFATKEEIWKEYGIRAQRPLKEATLERIARGIKKFVIDNPEPFIMSNMNNNVPRGVDEPVSTVTSGNRHYLVAPYLLPYHALQGAETRGQDPRDPIHTIDTQPRHALVAAFIAKHYGGGSRSIASGADAPLSTVTAWDHNSLVTTHLVTLRKDMFGQDVREPLTTITTSGAHFAEVRSFLVKYYGQGIGQDITDPLGTATTKDRFGLVNVMGSEYEIADIGMRMLTPRELFDAQGFPHDYIIDRDYMGNPYTKSKQIARCGNAVPPPFAEALTRANLPELCGIEDEHGAEEAAL